ncbi:MAG: hypothetical protein NT092_11655 [Bacteroidia bacterium]|nr:hypothetical protein [Bacteroidia bacterium]
MNKWFDIVFTAHGVLNLTPNESFTLCEKGAIIIDVREEYLNSFKMFKARDKFFKLLETYGKRESELNAVSDFYRIADQLHPGNVRW